MLSDSDYRARCTYAYVHRVRCSCTNNERGFSFQVIADESCTPAFVAADLLSQAEHGVDSQVVLVSSSLPDDKLKEVEKEVDEQARALPRVDIIRESVSRSLIVKTPGPEEALQFSNAYAPEHLILHLRDASAWVDRVKNAGSVFVGPYSPERLFFVSFYAH